MKIKTFVAAASTALVVLTGAATAGTVSPATGPVAGSWGADFNVTAVNVTNVNREESKATMANYNAALAGTLGNGDEVYNTGKFTYSGLVDFATWGGSDTTIGNWVSSGSGTSDLDLSSAFAGLTNSKGWINGGTATTTFYLFEALGSYSAGTFDIKHDDGILVDGVGGVSDVGRRQTRIEGFEGGALSFLYVSTNNDPSIFKVDSDVSPVPLPAAAWMLFMGVAGLGVASRRRKAA